MINAPTAYRSSIGLIVTPEGFPVAYEVLAGNTSDKVTLRGFLQKIESQYGKAERVWLRDRGIPTEAVLAEMRASNPPVYYLVGTPKGRLSKLAAQLLEQPWQQVRPGIEVKVAPQENELYLLAQSRGRRNKERAMRRRHLKALWKRLRQLQAMKLFGAPTLPQAWRSQGALPRRLALARTCPARLHGQRPDGVSLLAQSPNASAGPTARRPLPVAH